MTWNSSGFSKHYIQVTLEGTYPENFLNQCLRQGLHIRNVEYESDVKIRFQVSAGDFKRLKEMSGNRYNVSVTGQGGLWYRIKLFSRRKTLIAGLLLFAALFYYNSQFVSEIQVNGYESISEQALRKTIKEAGLYEGCRKNININKIKLKLYDEYNNISWVGITFNGNLARVTIAEGGQQYEPYTVEEDAPCNIVSDREGYIDSVIPRDGVRAVEDGAFVKKGTVLISGKVPLQSSAFGTEDEDKTERYVHAQGIVRARIPVRLTFYRTAYDMKMEPTGRRIWSVVINGHDFTRGLMQFKKSAVKHINIVNTVKPFKLKIQLACTEEVKVENKKASKKTVKKQVLNKIQEYMKENLPEDTQILNKSLNFTQEKNIITIGVTLETLQKIGIEEEITIDKSNRKSEENND